MAGWRGAPPVWSDQFTRSLHCENSLSREMPGIPWPPKGGHLGDLGGTHSSQSQGSNGCWNLEHLIHGSLSPIIENLE